MVTDPALEAVKQALRDEDKDPLATYQTLRDKLDNVKSKEIVEVLLAYLRETISRQRGYPANLGEVVFYLERVSGIKNHIDLTFVGPVYLNGEDWARDIEQWQNWWDANKDYIVWDEQSGTFKLRRP